MARASITLIRLTRTALGALTPATTLSSADGNYVTNDGATFLYLNNGSGGSRTVSVLVPEDVDQNLAVASRTFVLSAGQVGLTGTFPREIYGGQILVDVSGSTVTAVAYSVR